MNSAGGDRDDRTKAAWRERPAPAAVAAAAAAACGHSDSGRRGMRAGRCSVGDSRQLSYANRRKSVNTDRVKAEFVGLRGDVR